MSQPPTRHDSIATGASTGASTYRGGSEVGGGVGRSPRRRQPQEFLLPDGRRVLVALPEEAARLRARYAHDADNPDAVQVEVVVHGSAEHTGHLRRLRTHHEAARDAQRARHGGDFDAWERTRTDLDHVARQLDRLDSDAGDGGAEALNANFEKFGYTGVLRTFDDGDPALGGPSGVATPRRSLLDVDGDGDSSTVATRDWDDTRGGRAIKLFQKPVIKQYFHRGLLWRASGFAEVMSFELFFDLLYVGILDIIGEDASEHTTGMGLLRFVVTFVMTWKIWSDVQQTISWFETDDIMQRCQILFLIACLLGFTTNITQSFVEGEENTYVQLVSYYLAARLFQALNYALTACFLPLIRLIMFAHVLAILMPSALWIASIHVEMPSRLALIFVALALDLLGPFYIYLGMQYTRRHDTPLARRLEKLIEFVPAINIEHKTERTNAFVSLVIGYGVLSLLYQASGYGVNAFLGKAVLGLVQAFVFNWIYFEVDGDNIHVHAIRRKAWTAMLWQMIHLPFICGYVLASAALSRIVVATDAPDTDAGHLTEAYQHRSEAEVPLGLRLFYCVGLGVALLSMGVISASHVHKQPPATCRVPKRWRLANRAAAAAVLCCLPAAGDRLDSLGLIAVTMSLLIWVLAFELWGVSCAEDEFWTWGGGGGPGCGRAGLTYSARCGRRRLEDAVKETGEVDVVELGRGEKTAVDMPN